MNTPPFSVPRACRWLLGVGWVCLSSCSGPVSHEAVPPQPKLWSWNGDRVQGKPRIVINLSEQRITYFKGGQPVGHSPISSGREGYHTRTGTFRIVEKDIDHRSSLYGSYVDANGNVVEDDVDCRRDPRPSGTRFLGASMRYFMRITGAIGMHEGYLPGFPASHGCIRLPTEMARVFYHETPLGTPVQIVGNASVAVTQPAVPLAEERIAVPPPPPATAKARPARIKPPEIRKAPAPSRKRFRTPKPAPVPRGTTLYLEGYG